MTQQKKQRIKERDGNKCVVCNNREQLTIDHIIPQDMGGTDEDSNLQTLCRGCNVMKANKPPKFKRIFNFFFSRKTIYEFKNEIKHIIFANDGLTLQRAVIEAKEVIADQRKEIDELLKAITNQQVTHAQRMHKLAERIRGLQSHLKVEWVEETVGSDWLESPVTVRNYRKIKK